MTAARFSYVEGLRCVLCGKEYAFKLMLGGCPHCVAQGMPGILDPVYQGISAEMFTLAPGTLWDAHRTLPLPEPGYQTTLGEGGTPLLPITPVDGNWWIKYEAVNPTHSYKDRTNAVAVAVARYFGADKLVCTSTGNHGVALTAYAANAGLRCVVLMPPEAPELSLQEMRFFGAEVVIVEDGNIVPLLEEMVLDHGWYVSQRNAPGVGTRRIGNPYGMEGYKTISYEIYHQLGKRAPDRVFLPVGGGDAAWGVYKGFSELAQVGLIESVPQIVACQSIAGAPLVNAMENNLEQVGPVDTSPTIAFSIVERQTGDLALRAIRSSGGNAVAVTDEEIRAAARHYAAMGVCVESSSSAALAGAEKLAREGQLDPSETVVLIGTGAGLRWPETFTTSYATLPRIEGTISALERVIGI